MVDSIELRIGNIVLWKDGEGKQRFVKVIAIKEEQFHFEYKGENYADEFNVWPVLLTEDIVERIGFIKSENKEDYRKTIESSDNKVTIIIAKLEGELFDYLVIQDENKDDGHTSYLTYNAEIATLHDLQNVYYLIIHADLEVTFSTVRM